MNQKKATIIFLFLILINITGAEEEISSTEVAEEQNLSADELTVNETNETEITQEPIKDIIFKNFIPKEFKLGNAQFSIQIQSNKNETLSNIAALISGNGFSTYDITPIDSLEFEEKGYILVNGNFKESGLINLTIRVNKEIFYQEVNVLGESEEDLKKAEALLKQQEEKKKVLVGLSSKLEALEQNYSDLETQLKKKEEEDYDIKDVKLEDLKKYIRQTQASILGEHLDEARVNLGLAGKELNAVEGKIETLEKLPFMSRFREHLIVFSSIAGAVITFFALYELLKKKGKEAVTTIGNIKPKTEEKEQLEVKHEEVKQEEIKEEEKAGEEKHKEKKKPKKKKHINK